MSSRKRSPSASEVDYAEFPFTISFASNPSQAHHKNKKRKGDTIVEHLTVESKKLWQDMTRYNSFTLNGINYNRETLVYVANESTVKHQKDTGDSKGDGEKSDKRWVARILEIRASDEDHVYARVEWMYRPDDLPLGTIDRRVKVEGRQPYHGTGELIDSNHMDIINARSPVKIICKCKTAMNPDKSLIRCSSSNCRQWMHPECLTHDVLMQVYQRLGTDTPHRTEAAVLNEEKTGEATDPLSTTDAEQKETEPTIDVNCGKTEDIIHVKRVRETYAGTKSSLPIRTPSRSSAKSPAKNGRKKTKNADDKPYAGLYEADLKINGGSVAWEIRDLRESVTGGEISWNETAYCLICDEVINSSST
ncbi:hypothetical protein FLAG1_07853 [Fusarium langsethiae]|uniref:BAH domain-containing protein n=1 Tax=Fusarium langsethiae TaxID=179993 RepID=A0A0N0DD83_FUSLA|nr:hypothetical protein FLAG1_07853 [Fusarium langsethiae]GKU07203.1 unnamed protein product [Fusarium langsethiae]